MRVAGPWPGLRTAAACLAAFVLLALLVGLEAGVPSLDHRVEERLSSWPDAVRDAWLVATLPGGLVASIVIVLAGAGACLRFGSRRNAVLMVVGAVAVDLLVRALKLAFAVERPSGPADHDFGFPSGHAARATALLGMALLLAQASHGPARRRLPAAVMAAWLAVALVTAAGRVLGGVHWLSDAAGGVLLGLAAVGLVGALAERPGAARSPRLPDAGQGTQ